MFLCIKKGQYFLVVKGKTILVDFFINENLVPAFLDKEQNFLGKLPFGQGSLKIPLTTLETYLKKGWTT